MASVKQEPQQARLSGVKPEPNVEADSPNLANIPAAGPSASPMNSGRIDPEPSPEPEETGDKRSDTEYLQQLVSETKPEILEGGVEIGLQVLDGLKVPLQAAKDASQETEAEHWLKSIEDLEKQAQPTRTVIGVVGNTGAGKSSVINALLEEEKLLPTNCLRACTASPTEVSWNFSENPDELYRAEVEFISVADWTAELKIILDDLLDGNGEVSRECTNPDTEAGLAYAKMRAVYPTMTKEDMSNSSLEALANWRTVRTVLGSIKKLKERSSSALYKGLQRYVDSKEKTIAPGPPKKDALMEFWPLIKVVRIYTRAWALETGAVIVDLPGVHDSNAARAAVAANYMKNCTGLWILADITRAVDDKTAKSLLGDSFKRQLKYDGTYSAVTFICSKTDNILETEAADSLGIEAECAGFWEKIDELKKQLRTLREQKSALEDEKSALEDLQEDLDSKYDIWDDLATKLADGDTVYAPRTSSNMSSKKRKRQSRPSGSRKNRLSADSDDDENDVIDQLDSGSESDKENSQPEDRKPVNQDEIDVVMASIKEEKKKMRLKRREYDSSIKGIKGEIQAVNVRKEKLVGDIRHLCIKGRNDYSRGAIQNDFAAGIKELDQEAAIEEDEENFNPEEDIRDYAEVARSLRVFCVSSRAYQSLSGRLQKDDYRPSGFLSADDTEVPQLQKFARKLTEDGRARSCRAFLNDLNQLLNSMKLWATNDGSQSRLSNSDQKKEAQLLNLLLGQLDKSLTATVETCVAEIKSALADQLYDAFEKLIPAAADAAVPTASGWGAHRSLGGMYWSTYKATCRRFGVWAGASGARNWNAEMFEPISKHLASPWEKTFQRKIPQALDSFQKVAKKELDAFHQQAVATAAQRGTNYSGLNTLLQQLRSHSQTITDLPTKVRGIINELQKECNRAFEPEIQQAMNYAYVICTEERGPGSYARMKTHMVSHVETARRTMFRAAVDVVKAQLTSMCRQVDDNLMGVTEELYEKVERDYETVLVGLGKDSHASTPRAERLLRLEMTQPLEQADGAFAYALNDDQADTDPFTAADDDHDDGLHQTSQDEAAQDETGQVEATGAETGLHAGSNPEEDSVSDKEEQLIAAQLSGTFNTPSSSNPVKAEPEH